MLAPEVAACTIVLALLAAVVFGPHVGSAGFLQDDWDLQSQSRFAPEPGLWGAYEQAASMRFFDYRPVVSLVFATAHELLGVNVAAHLAIALAIGVLASVLLYCLLCALGIERLHAGAIAALSLLFPFSDTTRLWAAGGVNNLGVVFYLLGALVALRGLRAAGRRAVALHGGAVALYVLSVLTYQVAAVVAMLSGLLYAVRAPWRAVLPRWGIDVVAVASATAVVALNAPRRIQTAEAQVDHALAIVRQSFSLLAWTAFPFGAPQTLAVTAIALVIVAAALVRVHRRAPAIAGRRAAADGESASGPDAAADPVRAELVRWLTMATGAVLVIGAGYAIIAPANPFFEPLTPGTANRINGVPGLGFVMLVYATAMLAGVLALGARRVAALPALALSCVLAVGYTARVGEHQTAWADSWRLQRDVLSVVERSLAGRGRGATVYTFGHPIDAAPGVAVFRQLDLRPAVKVALGDPSLTGWPVLPRTTWACEADRVYPTNNRFGPQNAARYGDAFFVDVASARSVRIDSRAECERAVRTFRPGPLIAPARATRAAARRRSG